MQNITIPIDVPSDLLIALNESEQELKSHFQTVIAVTLFREEKLTLGKAIQLSGLSRFEFEQALVKRKIPISKVDVEQIIADAKKLRDV